MKPNVRARLTSLRKEAGERREQVLDRRDPRLALAQRGPQQRIADIGGVSPDIDHLRQVRPAKDDARIGRTGAQGHENLLARVQSHTRGPNRVLQRPLSDHALNDLFHKVTARRVDPSRLQASALPYHRHILYWLKLPSAISADI